MHLRRESVLGLFAAVVGLSCGKSSTNPPPQSTPRLTIVSGAGVTDTIEGTPTQGLVVQVAGRTGKPENGVGVQFESSSMSVAPVATGAAFGSSASAVTDADGRAVVRVRLGLKAGPAAVAVTVPLYGLADTARYTVLSGAAVSARIGVADTVLEIGSSFSMGGFQDRGGNVVSAGASYQATSPAVSVDAGGVVTAVATGRAYVRRTPGAGGVPVDSAGVTVVPKVRYVTSDGGPMYIGSLAGGPLKQIIGEAVWGPAWSPRGDSIAYFTQSALFVADTLGHAHALSVPGLPPAPKLPNIGWPAYTPDGRWLFVEVLTSYGTQVFRMHPDGSGAEWLTPKTQLASKPSPSPDGTRFVFTYGPLMIMSVGSTRVDTLVASSADFARWSPDGQWIAFIEQVGNAVGLIHPDGTGRRSIHMTVQGGLSWSPDSKWLIAGGFSLSLVDVAAGKAYSLVGSPGYYVGWKP